MEIYRDEIGTVYLYHPITDSLTVSATKNGQTVVSETTESGGDPTSGIHEATIPWDATEYDGRLDITWTNNAGFTRTTSVDIVTPLITFPELQSLLPDWSDADLHDIERQVRYVIQGYTGCLFGKWQETNTVYGDGSNKLRLPKPLLSFNSIVSNEVQFTESNMIIYGDGWFIGYKKPRYFTLKEAPPDYILDAYGGIITPPTVYYQNFAQDVPFTIDGVWGYNEIPAEIVHAAKMLVLDYSCDQSAWRDKYINNIKAADWQFGFDPNAFTGTGNVQVDQILNDFKDIGWTVI